MIKYLYKKCGYCSNILKIITEDSKVINVENGRQYPLSWGSKLSDKTILCVCGRENKVAKFKYNLTIVP